MEVGLLLFNTYILPENTEKDNYTPIRTCFTCYAFENHPTTQCPKKDIKICSVCAETGHMGNECNNTIKKCVNCGGGHRILAVSYPIKKEKINQVRNEQQTLQNRTENKIQRNSERSSKRSNITPKTEIILQHDMSLSILTACIIAHLNNIAEPGTFNTRLNYLLKKNNLPEFIAVDHAPSHKIFNIASFS